MAENKFIQQELFKFAFVPKYQLAIDSLANLADPEDWDFSDAKSRKHAILKSYLEHTFRKVRSEDKISFTSNNEYCCFNTGLVTKKPRRDIRILFQKQESRRRFAAIRIKMFLQKE